MDGINNVLVFLDANINGIPRYFFLNPMGAKKTGLGKALMRQRFKNGHNAIINPDGSIRHTHDPESLVVNMKSVTQENDLEAFLTTATLAGTDFVAGTILYNNDRKVECHGNRSHQHEPVSFDS